MVAVHARVGECEQRRRVLQNSTDVPAGKVRQTAVARLVVEQWLAIFPERLVNVHSRAIVAEERLWHESCGLAPAVCNVLHDVLELQDVVCRAYQGVEAVVDLTLAGGANLVVASLNLQASFLELENNVVAHVGMLVNRGDRKISALVWGLVCKVSAKAVDSLVTTRVPGSLA